MTMAPIYGREFAETCRRRHKSPAPCHWPQLLRVLALAALAGSCIFAALAPEKAKGSTPALFAAIAPF
ncbi:hypothetical protein [uncultured Rhodoblastus sp.]|uniref:hypothetical protein n=1 Tax=uncultured Rhodoblastus sp. TaxID=543037 RepID=UPI0025F2BBB0|nr:hypothetical protein [uncultured Rhodoblastus sp.]